MQNPPPNYGAAPQGASGKSALGLEGNVAAAIGYVIGILALILIFIEKDNRFVKFHALQSVFYSIGITILLIAFTLVSTVLTIGMAAVSESLGFIVGLLVTLVYLALVLAMVAGLIYAAYKAYQGQLVKLPIVGNLAEKIANK